MRAGLLWRSESKGPWLFALGVSIALHVLVYLAAHDFMRLPQVDLEFQLPSEAEFGVLEEPPEEPAPPTPEPTPPPQPSAPEADAVAPKPPIKPKPKPKPESPPEPPLPAALAAAGGVAKFAPKGSQLALRLDLDRLRNHPLADEAGALLRAIPDVRALLDGSGVDPLRDLSRLFLASPDLRRKHVVMAGKYAGDESVPRNAVAQLAEHKGLPAAWRSVRGMPTAPWHNADETERVVALLGPSVFAITRPDDLARVLAVARATRAQRAKENVDAGEALVHMDERELMNVAVESARSFVRGARAQLAPDQLVISVREQAADPQQLELSANARYPDAEQAEHALKYWEQLRAQYASHALVALMNLDRLLRDLKLSTRGSELTLELTVPPRQARLLLRFLRDSIRGPEPYTPPQDRSE
jgi:hypothetical protein